MNMAKTKAPAEPHRHDKHEVTEIDQAMQRTREKFRQKARTVAVPEKLNELELNIVFVENC